MIQDSGDQATAALFRRSLRGKPMGTLRTPCLVALSLFVLPGCPVQYTAPATQPAGLSPAGRDFEAVWQASRQTLRRYHFELDSQNRRSGTITTAPLTGMHFFEVWRKDAARPVDFGESTIQTLYRIATVTIQTVPPGSRTYQARVAVRLFRSSKPAPSVTSTSEAYALFNPRRGRRERAGLLSEGGAGGAFLVPLGHDRALEAKLTADIAAAADELRGVVLTKPRAKAAAGEAKKPETATKPASSEGR